MNSQMKGILTRHSFQKFTDAVGSGFAAGGRARVTGSAQTATAPAPPSLISVVRSTDGATRRPRPASRCAESCRAEVRRTRRDNGDIPRISVGINEVNVVFTVTDKHGKRVTDLKQADFRFVDDNKPATEIRSFHAETNLPLQVGLLIDASNSVRDRFKFEQESAIEFLNQTVRRGYDQAMVVGFDATPEVTQDFTDDTEKLGKGVRAFAAGRRNGAVRCALLRLPRQAAEESAERADAAGDHPAERWGRQPEPRNARGSD